MSFLNKLFNRSHPALITLEVLLAGVRDHVAAEVMLVHVLAANVAYDRRRGCRRSRRGARLRFGGRETRAAAQRLDGFFLGAFNLNIAFLVGLRFFECGTTIRSTRRIAK